MRFGPLFTDIIFYRTVSLVMIEPFFFFFLIPKARCCYYYYVVVVDIITITCFSYIPSPRGCALEALFSYRIRSL